MFGFVKGVIIGDKVGCLGLTFTYEFLFESVTVLLKSKKPSKPTDLLKSPSVNPSFKLENQK